MTHDPNLVSALEPSQLVGAMKQTYPRRKLGRGVVVLLVALRIYVIVAIPIVAYAFIHALRAPQ